MDAIVLSRIQFALTSSFHYIYPPMSIGIGLLIVIMEGIYLKTRNPLYKTMTKFWVKIFALTFALGVATGLVQVFGFGTNWAHYSRFVGDVFGGALGAEGIFAFFLEAGFLGVMLFGWDRVSPKMHYVSSCLVTLGAHFSAVWIVVANSWMQTPAGYQIINKGQGFSERAQVTDFWKMVFNPSSVDRLTHVILGCWLSGVFIALSVAAYYMLRNRHKEFSEKVMKIALFSGAIVLSLQLLSGDETARGVYKNQPEKFAAMEAVYETTEGATPITVAGWVDTKNRKVYGIKIPKMLTLFTFRDLKTPVQGFDALKTPEDEMPNVQLVFQSYHMMIACWGIMASLVAAALAALYLGRLEKMRLLLWGLVFSVFLPHVGNQMGWITAEAGRQPWIVWKVLKTVQGHSEKLSAPLVLASIIMFLVIYTAMFALFIYLLNKKIQHGPEDGNDDSELYRDSL